MKAFRTPAATRIWISIEAVFRWSKSSPNPDIRSSAEAHDYLTRLKEILEYLDVNDGNMEEGSLRCDANVSVRKLGEQKFGTRTELKNINSFRFVQKAIDFEIHRQIEVIESGGRVVQETRLWNSDGRAHGFDAEQRRSPRLPVFSGSGSAAARRRSRNGSNRSNGPCRNCPSRAASVSSTQYALSEYDAGVLSNDARAGGFFRRNR